MTANSEETVFIDLAVEGQALPLRINESPLLLLGFTQRPSDLNENPLVLARNLSFPNTKLGISIFSLGTTPDPDFHVKGLSLKLSFTASRNTQTATSPLKQITYDRFAIHPAPAKEHYCQAFGSPAVQAWNAFFTPSAPIYPSTIQKQLIEQAAEATFERFENEGAFFMTVILNLLLDNDETVVFRTDPEMIVKTIGPGSTSDTSSK